MAESGALMQQNCILSETVASPLQGLFYWPDFNGSSCLADIKYRRSDLCRDKINRLGDRSGLETVDKGADMSNTFQNRGD